MHKSKILIPAILMAVFGMAHAADVSKAQADAAIKEAKAAYSNVDATGFAWTETEEMIASAEKALEGGQLEDAVKFAQQATERSRLAYAQYEANKNADFESTSK